MFRRRTYLIGALAATMAALTLAACGSSSSTSSGGSASSSASSASAASTGSSSGATASNSVLEQAKKTVAELTQRPTTLVVPPLPSKPSAGKTVDFVVCATTTCQGFVPYLREATNAVGWKLNTVQGGFEPQQIAAAWNKVLSDKPNGVIASGGIPPELFAPQLSQLRAEGIPVVLHDQPATSNPAVTGVVLSDAANHQFGQELADLILSDANGKNVHLAMFVTPQVPVFLNEDKALTSTIGSSACQSCSVDKISFPVSAAGTTLPSQVVSYLRAHPSTNYVYFDFNDAVDGVPAALSRAGLSGQVKMVTNNIAQTEASYVRDGQLWAAAANPWPETMWQDFNVVLAKTENAPLGPVLGVQLPNWIITKQDLPNVSGPMFPLDTNYQQAFKQAWHVS
jgi:ABC-type sugar transport system substrate-binding protein